MTINGVVSPSLVDLFANGYSSLDDESNSNQESVVVKERVGEYLLFYRVKGSGSGSKKVLIKALKIDRAEENKGTYGLIGNAFKPKDEIEKFKKECDMRLDLAQYQLKSNEKSFEKKQKRELERMLEELSI